MDQLLAHPGDRHPTTPADQQLGVVPLGHGQGGLGDAVADGLRHAGEEAVPVHLEPGRVAGIHAVGGHEAVLLAFGAAGDARHRGGAQGRDRDGGDLEGPAEVSGGHDELLGLWFLTPSSYHSALEAHGTSARHEGGQRDPQRAGIGDFRHPGPVGSLVLSLAAGHLLPLLDHEADHPPPLLDRPVLRAEPAGADVVDLLVDVGVEGVEIDLLFGGGHVVVLGCLVIVPCGCEPARASVVGDPVRGGPVEVPALLLDRLVARVDQVLDLAVHRPDLEVAVRHIDHLSRHPLATDPNHQTLTNQGIDHVASL